MAVPVVDAVVARRNRLRARTADLRARHEWLDHLSRAGERYFQQRGNHFAAAVTFFSVLTAVPLLMVAFGAAGYVLWLNPTLLDDLRDAITAAFPGALSDAVIPFLDEAVARVSAGAAYVPEPVPDPRDPAEVALAERVRAHLDPGGVLA